MKKLSFFLLLNIFCLGAFAQIPSSFCDGNPADWANFKSTYPISSYIKDVANDGTNADNSFTQGSKDADPISAWRWVNGNTNNKGDISNAGVALTGANNCILRFFGDRTAVNGDASIGIWLFANPVTPLPDGTFGGMHTNGDLLISSNFTNGGSVPVIKVYVWENGTLVQKTSSTGAYCAAVNTTTSAVPAGLTYTSSNGGTSYAPAAFFEGAVDLCALGINNCFSQFIFRTRNSQSVNASLQDFAINSFNAIPGACSVVVTQPTCTVATGSVMVNNANSGYTYTLTGTNPVRTAISNHTGNFTNLASGTYSLVVSQSNCTAAPVTVVINAQPPTPAAPSLTVMQPTCASSANSISVVSPGAGFTYSLDGGAFTTATSWSNLTPGVHCVRACNTYGCISAQTCVTVNTQPATPSAPVISVTQPTCTSSYNSLTVTSTVSGYTFSLDGGSFTTTYSWSNLSAGTHCVRVCGPNGCISAQTCVTVNPQPQTPFAPTLNVVHPTCTSASNSLTVTSAILSGYTFSLDGGAFTSTYSWYNLAPGTHCVRVCGPNGCISAQTCITINQQPATPARPSISITEATLCGSISAPYITVNCPVAGNTYTLTQTGMTPRTMTYSGTGSLMFDNLTAGKGFMIQTTNSYGCISAKTDCNNYTTNQCASVPKAAPATVEATKPATKVVAFPNPYSDKINFRIESAVSGKGTLELYNFAGQKIRTVFQGYIAEGQGQTIEFAVPVAERSNLIYVLKVGKERVTGKLIQAD